MRDAPRWLRMQARLRALALTYADRATIQEGIAATCTQPDAIGYWTGRAEILREVAESLRRIADE